MRPNSVDPSVRRSLSSIATLTLTALATAGTLQAQGFGIFEHGTCAMGRAGAVVAAPCEDGSAVFYNPAALAGTEGWTVSAGATLFAITGGFIADETGERTDLENDVVALPHFFASYGINERLGAGVGVFVPFGLETEWPKEDFDGSFVGYNNGLFSVYVQPTLAYQATDWLSIGGGPILVIGRVKLTQLLDLSTQELPAGTGAPAGTTFGQLGVPFHTQFADAQLDASGATGYGGHFAAQVQATEQLSFGVRYMTRVELDYEGDAEFTQVSTGLALPADNPLGVPGGTPLDLVLAGAGLFQEGAPLSNQSVETSITMPDMLVAGVAYQATPQLLLAADYQWVNWSIFDEIVVDFEIAPTAVRIERYEDTSGFRLGGEYEIDPMWTLRGGYLWHEGAAPEFTVTPLLPEGVRNEGTIGLGWHASDRLEFNVAYQYIGQEDRRGRVRDELPGEEPTVALNSGLFEFTGHLFGGTVTLHF